MDKIIKLIEQYPQMSFSLTCYPRTYDLGTERWEAVLSWIKKVKYKDKGKGKGKDKNKEVYTFISSMGTDPFEVISSTIAKLEEEMDEYSNK